MSELIGYHDHLPIKAGDKVRIKRGTRIRTTAPNRNHYEAGKTRTVTVHHTLPGSSFVIGDLFKNPDGTERFSPCQRLKDVAHYAEHPAMPSPCRDADATFTFLRENASISMDTEGRTMNSGAVHYRVWMHTDNPSVVWSGRGGYWQEVDINEVEKVEE